jgi:cobalt/nickel transport system permease protein
MHIADGIIPLEIAAAADALALGGVYLAGKKADLEEVPKMGIMAAALFTVSLIHFPLAGTSLHLGLFGLAGLLLGARAFPVIFITLLFQSLIFQHGGLISVGINAVNMGLGALAGMIIWRLSAIPEALRSFAAGFFGILVPAVLMAGEFSLSGYGKGILFIILIYLPAAAIEGALTATAVAFFRKAKPEILGE